MENDLYVIECVYECVHAFTLAHMESLTKYLRNKIPNKWNLELSDQTAYKDGTTEFLVYNIFFSIFQNY